MKKLFLLFVFGALALTSNLDAQISTPAASPSAKFMQTVGLTDVTIEYSRPSMKGRTIFAAEGLVPFGKIWRTGANSATKITFSDDVKVGGKELKAGSYAMLTKPDAMEWAVHFYSHESSNWGSYTDKEPAAAVMVKPQTMPEGINVQSFTMGVGNLTNTSAAIEILWANTYVAIPLEVDVDSKVMASIDKTLGGPSSNDFYAAGQYYHQSGKDLAKALKYVQKATHADSPRFWQVRTEALILADMGNHVDAIKVATKSMELAQKAGNDDYVRMNKKSIASWSHAKSKMK